MKTEHAPGPWLVTENGKSFGVAYVTHWGSEGAEGMKRLATISTNVEGQEANARLIAAAPDLLAALANYQRLVAYLQRTTNPEEWAEHGDWKRLQLEADAAIAKAKGEA